MKCKVFISYRRDDSNDVSNLIFTKLQEKIGANEVYLDTNANELGDDWKINISKNLEEAQIVLVVIGREWLTAGVDKFGLRRIDNEEDMVRKEIEIALKKNKIIIPVLVNDAQIPPPYALPDSIKNLNNYQYDALTISSEPNNELDRLCQSLKDRLDKMNAPDELRDNLEKILVEKYKIVKQIGSGPTFKVYLAKDTALERNVTIRAIQDPEKKGEFIDMIRNAAKIVEQVPNCTPILGAWIKSNPVHVVMSYLEYGTLRDKIDETEGRGLPLQDVHHILLELGNALSVAHRIGVTHCNIKPSNVLLSANNQPFLSPLCRLQRTNKTYILKRLSNRLHEINSVLYQEEICYLPPEIFDVNYIEKSQTDRNEKIDQYMLGLMTYELLDGKIPNTISSFKEDLKIEDFNQLKTINSIRKDCPSNLSCIIHKMISFNPEDRYDSIDEALSEIKKVSFDNIEIAKESFTRCILNKSLGSSFFKTFYNEFLRLCPDAARKFVDKGIGSESAHKQYDKLREAIFILLIFAEKQLGKDEPNVLTRIADRHNKDHYDIPIPFYSKFLEALTNTICGAPPYIPKGFDEQCNESENEKERIRKAWEKALEPGIEYMKRKYWGSIN